MYRQDTVFSHLGRYSAYLFLFPLLFTIETTEAKDIIGIYERVKINDVGLIYSAKIDTGAKNSSLNIKDIHLSQKDGGIWVKFDVDNLAGKTITLEKPLKRFAHIKRKKADTQQRPVVMLDICIGNIVKQAEVNLVDRSNFNYQLLIGQSFLHGDFIVDVSKSYTTEPNC